MPFIYKVIFSSYLLIYFVQAFILKDQFLVKTKQDRKVDVAEDRFFPEFTSVFPFWSPIKYFNLCPFVKPLPKDPVWNRGCAPLRPPPMAPRPRPASPMAPRLRPPSPTAPRPRPESPVQEVEEEETFDYIEKEHEDVHDSDYDEYGYANSKSFHK